VIPSKTRKKFLIYYLQPTWKIRFQHSKIEEQVQRGHPKNISKKASLCTQTGKTHAPRRSQLLSQANRNCKLISSHQEFVRRIMESRLF
jgi:hypothetical protein